MQFSGGTMTAPRVTLAMPIVAASESLVYALRSVLLQSFTSFELLLPTSVDLGKREYQALLRDPRIIVWRDDAERTMAARLNECIERARGAYFARMLPDDMSYPSRLRAQVDFLELNPEVDVVGAQMLAFRGASIPVGKISAPTDHYQLAMSSQLGIKLFEGTSAGKTSWFQRHGFDEGCAMDEHQELLSRTLGQSRFAVLPRILYAARRRESTISWPRNVGGMNPRREAAAHIQIRARGVLPAAGRMLLYAAAAVTGLRHRIEHQPAAALSAAELEEWMEVREALLDCGIDHLERQAEAALAEA